MSESVVTAPESTQGDVEVDRDWRYFAEALAWYPGHGLTGAQVFGVVQQIRAALRDGRITPEDLGIR